MQTCAAFAKDWFDDWIWIVVDAGISSFGNTWEVVPLALVELFEVVVIVVVDAWLVFAWDAMVVFCIFTTPTFESWKKHVSRFVRSMRNLENGYPYNKHRYNTKRS